MSRDVLHVQIGISLFLIMLLILRRPKLSWTCVFTSELLNEINDLYLQLTAGDGLSIIWLESVKDILLTIAAPTLILIAIEIKLHNTKKQGWTRRT